MSRVSLVIFGVAGVLAPQHALAAAQCLIATSDLPAGVTKVPSPFKKGSITVQDENSAEMDVFEAGGPLKERLLTIDSVATITSHQFTPKYVSFTWMKPEGNGSFWLIFTNKGGKIVDQKYIFSGLSERNVTTVMRYEGWGLHIATDAALFLRSVCFAGKKSELPVP